MLDGNNQIKNHLTFKDSSGYPAFYIFNYEDNAGFLIVSADYNISPILAYVPHGSFERDTVPAGLVMWVDRTLENTEIVRKGLYDNSKLAHAAWNHYFNLNNIQSSNSTIGRIIPPPSCVDSSHTTTVGPLVPVTWGQLCTYNELCPNKSCNVCNVHAPTGCVATAMAQIIRYWEPVTSYSYNYTSMPTNHGNGEVQRLMRDIGLSANVDMDYECDGSSALGSEIPGALKNHFGFSSANRIVYGSADYLRVKNNLSNNWPVLLEGCSSRTWIFGWKYDDCHVWIVDGYREYESFWCKDDDSQGGSSSLMFHVNWGWHEIGIVNDYNGWYGFDNWDIPEQNLNFQYANMAVTEIHL